MQREHSLLMYEHPASSSQQVLAEHHWPNMTTRQGLQVRPPVPAPVSLRLSQLSIIKLAAAACIARMILL
jgi:hypothetical protein